MDVTLVLVTLLSLGLAAVMTLVAWRLARDERRRSEARVVALAGEIQPSGDLPLQHRTPVATGNDLFAGTAHRSGSSSRTAAVVMGAVAVVLAAAFLWSSASRSSAASSSQPSKSSAPQDRATAAAPARQVASTPTVAPLELTALTHERDANKLTVRGLVRNPASGRAIQGITAVVFLFDRSGNFVTSGRAPLESLPAGGESPFVVTIPDVKDVGRYRVSFRTDDRIVPHIDQRDRREQPVAQAR
jgi:hypothetical protein